MRRHNPLRLSDKEDDFLKELLELVAASAGKEKESDLDELLEFYTFKDKDIRISLSLNV
jgi:hypothetical protein